MTKRPFREHHLLELLHEYEESNHPLDLAINHYFRNHKALGSKDRGFIAETAYGMIRWMLLIDHLIESEPTWEKRLDCFLRTDLTNLSDTNLPPHILLSCPQFLFDHLVHDYGLEMTQQICQANNQPAPTTIRVNTLKTTRDQLLKKWQSTYQVRPCSTSETGIIFTKKINFFTTPEFHEGLFEVQDEGSQLVCKLVEVKPGEQFMDYCAGSGGKTLAIAPQMHGKGQIYLHDVRQHALAEAKKRLKRAGIQNAQILYEKSENLKKLKKKMEWVLVDAPCSGTGTLRRNPDMKWKLSQEMIDRLIGQQRMIFETALSFLKPGGHIVYATCSILKKENERQTEHFLSTYPLELIKEFRTCPSPGSMDGFYAAQFKLPNS